MPATSPSMTLADFILSDIEVILDAWEAFARGIPCGRRLDKAMLRDHGAGILRTVAADMVTRQSAQQQSEKSKGLAPPAPRETAAELHGTARLLDGFGVSETASEFRALRASVLRLWTQKIGGAPVALLDEVTRFNESIDQSAAESLARYAATEERQVRLYTALLAVSPDLKFIIGLDGKLLYANQAIAALLGRPISALRDSDFFALCRPFSPDLAEHARLVAEANAAHRSEWRVALASGVVLFYECLLVPVLDQLGAVEALAGTARDITERKQTEERILRSANYDSLTDLPNRSLFRERLTHELKHAQRTGLSLALLFIDLDGFKAVNDRLGHAAGDALLRQAAQRISMLVRDTDTVARLGGDEFTIILTDITMEQHIEDMAAEIVAELDRPFALGQATAKLSGSVGVAVFPQDGGSPDELLMHADAAMYAAKKAGRNCFRLFKSREIVT